MASTDEELNRFKDFLNAPTRATRSCPHCDRLFDVTGHPGDIRIRCLKCGEELIGTVLDDAPREPLIDPESRLGKYVFLRKVGQGGMATIYEAEDTELKRKVALKIIREGEGGTIAVKRLHREAAIAAQLQHPNIVGVHEVGMLKDASGRPTHFIAMDFVEGGTFADVLRDPKVPRADRLRMLEDATRAVAHAHDGGVTHRDLKPSNLLVDKAGRVLVADFGLARAEMFATQLTQEQAVMGTPQYMAPEQVLGKQKEIDARTDVYALGGILYEVLVGRTPFASATLAELFDETVNRDPVPPRKLDRTIPPDLEVICLKALGKRKSDRYLDARAMAEDLRRFRCGETVEARPRSLFYKIRTGIGRYRRLLAAGAGGLALFATVGATLGWVFWEKRNKIEKRRLEELIVLRKNTQEGLAFVLELRRAGNLAGATAKGEKTKVGCWDFANRWPESAEPHFLLGRIYRTLLQPRDALTEQRIALDRDPNFASALYERIVLTWMRWSMQNSEALEGSIRADFTRLVALVAMGKAGLTAHQLDAAWAFACQAAGNAEKASILLSTIADQGTELEEVYDALGDLATERGRWEEAIRLSSAGHVRDKGYPAHLRRLGFCKMKLAVDKSNRGEEPGRLFEEAVEALDGALRLDDTEGWPWVRRGQVHLTWGTHLLNHGEDPRDRYRAAARDFERSTELDPQRAEGFRKLGVVYLNLGQYEEMRGEDSAETFRLSAKHLDKALLLEPNSTETLLKRARVAELRALRAQREGRNPHEWYVEALDRLWKGLRLRLDAWDLWMRLGVILGEIADFLAEGGCDAEALFIAAISASSKGIEVSSAGEETYWRRGNLFARWGFCKELRGEDPVHAYSSALYDYAVVLARSPRSEYALTGTAFVHLRQGSPERALELVEQVLRHNPNSADARELRGEIHFARRDYEKARGDFEQAIQLDRTTESRLRRRIERCEAEER